MCFMLHEFLANYQLQDTYLSDENCAGLWENFLLSKTDGSIPPISVISLQGNTSCLLPLIVKIIQNIARHTWKLICHT